MIFIYSVFIIIASLSGALFISKYFFIKNDVSLKSPIEITTKTQKWLISYAAGKVHEANQNFLTYTAINKGFDAIVGYKPHHIDHQFYVENRKILDQKRGAGYWLWKPYFILKTLNKMEEGDFLFYVDAGVMFCGEAETYIKKMNESNKDIILFGNSHTNRNYVKKDAYSLMDMDENIYRDKLQLDAGISIIIRNTEKTRKIISNWLEYCKNPVLLTDMKSKGKEFPDFKDHRHDQAILTMVYYKNLEDILLIKYEDAPYAWAGLWRHHGVDMKVSLLWAKWRREAPSWVNKLLPAYIVFA